MRRAQPLHPAALLIDQDGRVTAEGGAEIVDQPAQRVGVRDIALEDDQTPGLGVARNWRSSSVSAGPATPVMKARIAGRLACAAREGQARAAPQFLWTMQLPPAAFRLEHIPAACSIEAKGPTSAR